MSITSTVCLDPGLYYLDGGMHISGNGTITACPQTTNPLTGVTTPPSSVDTGSGILLYLDELRIVGWDIPDHPVP
jgi:hypothetical protein